jgi:hypothetical protein
VQNEFCNTIGERADIAKRTRSLGLLNVGGLGSAINPQRLQ